MTINKNIFFSSLEIDRAKSTNYKHPEYNITPCKSIFAAMEILVNSGGYYLDYAPKFKKRGVDDVFDGTETEFIDWLIEDKRYCDLVIRHKNGFMDQGKFKVKLFLYFGGGRRQ